MAKFFVEYDVRGKCSDYIEADTREEALAAVREKMKNDENFLDLEELTDVDYSVSEMFKVIRNGQVVQTTFVRRTDERVA